MINNKVSSMKTNNELMMQNSPIAKELIYSMKVNLWMHDDPQRLRITKLQPMYKGTRE